MKEDLFNIRKKEFKEYVINNRSLPIEWKVKFLDGEDMRIWFNKISKSEKFKDFVEEIDDILKKYNLKILTQEEKAIEFLNYIYKYDQIPFRGQAYFSDNDEMRSWYDSYKENNRQFETSVHNNLTEYRNLDLAEIWSFIKKEFIGIIKKIKRIPNHGEYVTQNGIDVRVIFDKLETFDPKIYEQIMLYLEGIKTNNLSIEERKKEFLECVYALGYIPFLQECRFKDGTDMFTWYSRYKDKIDTLESEIDDSIKRKNKDINIYLVPNFKKSGGKFYTICTNVGEILDLSQISSFEEAKELDDTLVKRGGLILKKDEEIGSVNFVKGKKKK